MPEPISNPSYWAERLRKADPANLHHSIFRCPLDRWRRIEESHRRILAKVVTRGPYGTADSILDAGCGYGRLLTLLPDDWHGIYRGIDLSPDFVNLARILHPGRRFRVGDLRKLPYDRGTFDLGVLISMRPMVRRNLGDEEWSTMEEELQRVCRRLLYLEYDENDVGSVERGCDG